MSVLTQVLAIAAGVALGLGFRASISDDAELKVAEFSPLPGLHFRLIYVADEIAWSVISVALMGMVIVLKSAGGFA